MPTATAPSKSRTPKTPKATATRTPKASPAPARPVAATPAAAPTPTPTPSAPVSAPAPSAARRGRDVRRKADLLKMVADPCRMQIIAILAANERNVGALCDEVGMGQPGVSHHLANLRHAGIVEPRRDGKSNYYNLTDLGRKLAQIAAMLD